jgi:hypothetical protein
VGPAADWTRDAASLSRAHSRLCHRSSKSSLIALGDLIALLDVMPKNATTRSPAVLVVTDGATKDVFLGVNAPLCESTGVDTSTPLTSMIAPAADTDEERVHV